jgi:glycosyltransferase involved in cell wall biosynthesis
MADLTSRMAAWLGKPVVMWLHGGALPEFSAKHPDRVRAVLARGACIVSPSPYLAHWAGELGFPAQVIPNLLQETYPFRLRSHVYPRLLWMRTFHDLYHPEMAVEVLARLRRRYPDASLTMAGQDRGLQQRVREYSASFNLNGSLRLPGFLSSAEKAAAFASHDIYLNTNRVDNTPVSLIEAASAGLPVVATRVGGIPYLLEDHRQALLVADGDSDAMAGAVEHLLEDPDLAARLSQSGYELAEQSRWDNVRARWLSLFEELGQ